MVQKLNGALKALSQDKDYEKQMYGQGNVVTCMTPEEVGRMLSEDIDKLGARLKASGINLQE